MQPRQPRGIERAVTSPAHRNRVVNVVFVSLSLENPGLVAAAASPGAAVASSGDAVARSGAAVVSPDGNSGIDWRLRGSGIDWQWQQWLQENF